MGVDQRNYRFPHGLPLGRSVRSDLEGARRLSRGSVSPPQEMAPKTELPHLWETRAPLSRSLAHTLALSVSLSHTLALTLSRTLSSSGQVRVCDAAQPPTYSV